ncbi:hypothetical protein [Streptomyces spectabilis]|uniref:Uncharacterized protein n=1 Tax=Streptomyces spectabilis TaxID=68270 RepID=A0A5P2X151_STRST|nr:hypothetical protein [Streptomyces spectabilis]MBB5105732.1 hypothetical protein [Streptomyces spectabilis]MCI3901266.1 hypothetical protein [Streptomyces spectabilis]QEV58747.1 hypothetical protein CP982_08445 [Streptomyces spectabilis]GGV23781.1 hypothetical protein GCM10010245_39400 [Streptomyces spectabilis]
MTPTHAPAGQHRRTLAPQSTTAESVPRRSPYAQQQSYSPQAPYAPQTSYAPSGYSPQHQPPPPQPAPPQDPPIYRALVRLWSDRGRTLPGRHDPEWVRLAAPPAPSGQFTGHFGAPQDMSFDSPYDLAPGARYETGRGAPYGTRGAGDDTLPVGGHDGYGRARHPQVPPVPPDPGPEPGAERDARPAAPDPRLLISPAPQSSFGLRPGSA